jgi:hypothetical protein
VKAEDVVRKALAELDRNEDGGVNDADLLDRVTELLPFDPEAAHRAIARRAINKLKRPGSTEREGQLQLPGFEPYGYEPGRLIDDGEGHLVEQAQARPNYKAAEVTRAQRNLDNVAAWLKRKNAEHLAFTTWALDQFKKGRDPNDVVFDNFVRETETWSPAAAPAESGPDDQEEIDE